MKAPGTVAAQIGERLLPALTVVVFVLGWEFFVRARGIAPIYLPAPSAIAVQLYRMAVDGSLLHHLGLTLARIFAGFALAGVCGILVGLLMGMSRLVARGSRRLDRGALPITKDIPHSAPDHLAWYRRSL